MEEKEQITKPSLDLEVRAEVVGMSTIENNINEVKNVAIKLKKYYETTVFSDDDMKVAKDEKAQIKKFQAKVKEFKKQIIDEFNKPIKTFENTAKETITLLDDAYNTINIQVAKYENDIKAAKEKEVIAYYDELVEKERIDFITYQQIGINVTLTASLKSLKEKIKTYIDKIVNELELIETQEHKTEILVEYKHTLNVALAITNVNNRFKAIEEEKLRQEEISRRKMEEQQAVKKVEKVVEMEPPKVIIPKPNNFEINTEKEESIQEKQYEMSFKVYGTIDQLKEIKQFLEKGDYRYDSI